MRPANAQCMNDFGRQAGGPKPLPGLAGHDLRALATATLERMFNRLRQGAKTHDYLPSQPSAAQKEDFTPPHIKKVPDKIEKGTTIQPNELLGPEESRWTTNAAGPRKKNVGIVLHLVWQPFDIPELEDTDKILVEVVEAGLCFIPVVEPLASDLLCTARGPRQQPKRIPGVQPFRDEPQPPWRLRK